MNKVENNSGIIHACYTEATRAGEHFIEDPAFPASFPDR